MSRNISLGILDIDDPGWTFEVAPLAERLGYSRYWIGEHHGRGAANASPDIMTALVAGLTTKIRVGPAGVLLNYRSPLKIAEDFRLLSLLFPGRIDLGLAKGVVTPDIEPALLDGRPRRPTPDEYVERVADVCGLLNGGLPVGHPLALAPIPPAGDIQPPVIWVLGASRASATFAARLGTAYCVSEHLATDDTDGPDVARCYQDNFRPSPGLAAPLWSVCARGSCANVEAVARRSLSWLPGHALRITWVGTPSQCREQLLALCGRYETRDVMVCDLALSLGVKRRSYKLLAGAVGLKPC